MRGTYVANSMEEARRDAQAGMMALFVQNKGWRGMQIFLNPGEEVGGDTKLDWDFFGVAIFAGRIARSHNGTLGRAP